MDIVLRYYLGLQSLFCLGLLFHLYFFIVLLLRLVGLDGWLFVHQPPHNISFNQLHGLLFESSGCQSVPDIALQRMHIQSLDGPRHSFEHILVVLAIFVEPSESQLLDLVLVLQGLLCPKVLLGLVDLLLESVHFEVVAVTQQDGLYQLLVLPAHEHCSQLVGFG